MIFHADCEGYGCRFCQGYMLGWAHGRQEPLDEIADRLSSEHPAGCFCTACRIVADIADSIEVSTWSTDAACPFDCKAFPHQLDCPSIAVDVDRLLLHLQERRDVADQPEYITPASIAEGSGVAGPDVVLLMGELFVDAELEPDGYSATTVFETLDDLTPNAG